MQLEAHKFFNKAHKFVHNKSTTPIKYEYTKCQVVKNTKNANPNKTKQACS